MTTWNLVDYLKKDTNRPTRKRWQFVAVIYISETARQHGYVELIALALGLL